MSARKAWEAIPPHLHASVANYLLFGLRPGGTLQAFFENDLFTFLNCASGPTLAGAMPLCQFMMNYAPRGAYGHAGCVDHWMSLSDETRSFSMRQHAPDAIERMLDASCAREVDNV